MPCTAETTEFVRPRTETGKLISKGSLQLPYPDNPPGRVGIVAGLLCGAAVKGYFGRRVAYISGVRTVHMKTALYPGSFDPVTNGHLDVIRRASRLFDRLIVGVGRNTSKQAVFTVAERTAHLKENCADLTNVDVTSFSGLLTEAVRTLGATAVVRGLRAVSDFEFEFQMALMNRELSPECETVFLMPSPEYSYISSTMLREIARFGGDVSAFVPEDIAACLRERLGQL